jgi:hypothetical protein
MDASTPVPTWTEAVLGTDLAPDDGWAAAGLLNALSIIVLMWWESSRR